MIAALCGPSACRIEQSNRKEKPASAIIRRDRFVSIIE